MQPHGLPQHRGWVLSCLANLGVQCWVHSHVSFEEGVTNGSATHPLDRAEFTALAQVSTALAVQFVLEGGWFPPDEGFPGG